MNDLMRVDFRDGERDVPAYFVRLMSASGIDFYSVTFEEARTIVGKAMARNHLNDLQERLVVEHLVRYGQWE